MRGKPPHRSCSFLSFFSPLQSCCEETRRRRYSLAGDSVVKMQSKVSLKETITGFLGISNVAVKTCLSLRLYLPAMSSPLHSTLYRDGSFVFDTTPFRIGSILSFSLPFQLIPGLEATPPVASSPDTSPNQRLPHSCLVTGVEISAAEEVKVWLHDRDHKRRYPPGPDCRRVIYMFSPDTVGSRYNTYLGPLYPFAPSPDSRFTGARNRHAPR